MRHGYKEAREVASGCLYHYEKFCPEWLEHTLRDREIYCSDPGKLNDPWDCRPFFDWRPLLEDPVGREGALEFYRRNLPAETFNDPRRPLFEDRFRNNDEFCKKTIEQFSPRLAGTLQNRRIYCLTPHPLSTLMWSHYGGQHTGICLEFHIGNPLFSKALGVRYREQYPPFSLSLMTDPSEALALMLTKANCWAYKEEFRLIGSPLHRDGEPPQIAW
jgi:hypothetical protein